MKEVVKNCYCDILSEHNNQRVAGASTREVVVMVQNEDDQTYSLRKATLDMCPECFAKYSANLYLTYGPRGKVIYSFDS